MISTEPWYRAASLHEEVQTGRPSPQADRGDTIVERARTRRGLRSLPSRNQGHKPVRLSGHARQQLEYRGATEADVVETIRSAPWTPAERGRLECRKDFAFGGVWNGVLYTTRQVRPIFVDEPGELVVVTLYVYYF